MRNQTKEITMGAMMISLIAFLTVIDRQFAGGLDFLLSLFAGIPIVVFTVKYGLKSGVWVVVAASIVSFMFALPATLIYTVSSMICGLIFGAGIKHEWPGFMVISVTFLLKFIINFLTTVVFMSFFGYDSDFQTQLLNRFNMNSPEWIVSIEILASLLMSIMETVITYIGAQTLLKRFKLPMLRTVDIYKLVMPRAISVATIVSLLLLVLAPLQSIPLIFYQSIVFIFVLGCFFSLFQGYLIVVIWLTRINKRKLLPFAILSVFILPLTIAYVVIGCIDGFIDIKKKILDR